MNLSQVLQQFGSLSDVLIWMATAGGAMWLFGVIDARLLENWVAWHNFPAWVKKLVPIVLSGLFAVLANILISVEIVQFIPEFVAVILLAGFNYVVNQKEYQKIKDSSYGDSARETAGALTHGTWAG